jgi:hypothetical protein
MKKSIVIINHNPVVLEEWQEKLKSDDITVFCYTHPNLFILDFENKSHVFFDVFPADFDGYGHSSIYCNIACVLSGAGTTAYPFLEGNVIDKVRKRLAPFKVPLFVASTFYSVGKVEGFDGSVCRHARDYSDLWVSIANTGYEFSKFWLPTSKLKHGSAKIYHNGNLI